MHQFVPWLEPGATGTHTVEVQRLLRDMGLPSEIYTENAVGEMERRARPFADYGGLGSRPRAGDVLLYQMGIGSIVADYLLGRSEPLAVNFHNVTPPEYFDAWEPGLGHGSAWGLNQLPQLARRSEVGIAVSPFNEAGLRAAGFRRTVVAPILVDLDALERRADPTIEAELRRAKAGGGADVVFAGRIAPNKAQHDLVKAFAAYRRHFDPHARLHLIGGAASPAYVEAIRRFSEAAGLHGAVHVAGQVSDGALVAHYRVADVVVCLSEHEGFWVPALEAWHYDVPVIAYAAAALPDTIAGGGLLLDRKDPTTVAAAIDRVVRDETLRAEMIEAGRSRLADFALERTRARFREVVEQQLAPLA